MDAGNERMNEGWIYICKCREIDLPRILLYSRKYMRFIDLFLYKKRKSGIVGKVEIEYRRK